MFSIPALFLSKKMYLMLTCKFARNDIYIILTNSFLRGVPLKSYKTTNRQLGRYIPSFCSDTQTHKIHFQITEFERLKFFQLTWHDARRTF